MWTDWGQASDRGTNEEFLYFCRNAKHCPPLNALCRHDSQLFLGRGFYFWSNCTKQKIDSLRRRLTTWKFSPLIWFQKEFLCRFANFFLLSAQKQAKKNFETFHLRCCRHHPDADWACGCTSGISTPRLQLLRLSWHRSSHNGSRDDNQLFVRWSRGMTPIAARAVLYG